MKMPTFDELMEEVFKRHGDKFASWGEGGDSELTASNLQLENATDPVLMYLMMREMNNILKEQREFLLSIMPTGQRQ